MENEIVLFDVKVLQLQYADDKTDIVAFSAPEGLGGGSAKVSKEVSRRLHIGDTLTLSLTLPRRIVRVPVQ